MPIGQTVYSPLRVNLNLLAVSRVSAETYPGSEMPGQPG
jgi:hypothetical protein